MKYKISNISVKVDRNNTIIKLKQELGITLNESRKLFDEITSNDIFETNDYHLSYIINKVFNCIVQDTYELKQQEIRLKNKLELQKAIDWMKSLSKEDQDRIQILSKHLSPQLYAIG